MEFLSPYLGDIWIAIRSPFLVFLDPATILYWPYLLSAGIFALAVPMIIGRRTDGSVLRALKAQFAKRIWWAASSKADYRYYIINSIIFPAILAPAILSSFWVGEVLSQQLSAGLGARLSPATDPAYLRIAYTILFFLAYDLGRFLAHWLQHKNAFLWQFHKVYHSAEVLTPITSARFHPVDLVVMAFGGNALGGIVTGIFLYLGAGEISIHMFLGLHIGIGIYNLTGNLRHSHVWLDYGPLSYIFISPAQHQIHHSRLPEHRDKNCGFAFAFWDALFGTLYVPKDREVFPMGLGDGTDGEWHSIWRMYVWPVRMAAKRLTGREPLPDENVQRPLT